MKPITTSIIIMLRILAFGTQSTAQNLASQPKPTAKQTKPADNNTATPQFLAPISVQVLFCSQGIGADVKYGLMPKLSGRFGFGIIPVTANNLFSFSTLPVQSQASARFSNIHLLGSYAPFKTQRIRLVGGAAWLIKGSALVTMAPSGTNQFGSQTITADQIGSVTSRASWQGVAPYLGVALFNSFPNRMFNVKLDLGACYIASPGTSFTGTKLLAHNSINAAQFDKKYAGLTAGRPLFNSTSISGLNKTKHRYEKDHYLNPQKNFGEHHQLAGGVVYCHYTAVCAVCRQRL